MLCGQMFCLSINLSLAANLALKQQHVAQHLHPILDVNNVIAPSSETQIFCLLVSEKLGNIFSNVYSIHLHDETAPHV